MILAVDVWVGLGSVAGAFGTIIGALALWRAKGTERRSADREETEQALNAQSALLDRYEKRIEHLEQRNENLHTKVNDALAKYGLMQLSHKECEERLSHAEARIAELGG